MCLPLAPDLRIPPADARDTGRAAADRARPRLRAEVRRHPGAGRGAAGRAARRSASGRASATRRRRSSRRSSARSRRRRRTLRAPLTPRRRDRRARRAGRPAGFQRLQGRIHLRSAPTSARVDQAQPVALILFDLLRDGDEDMRGLPLTERRARLEAHFGALTRTRIRLSEQAVGDGARAPRPREGRRMGGADRQGGARPPISPASAARRGAS